MEYLKSFEAKLGPLLNRLKEEFSAIRTNRPSPKLIENVRVDYLGQTVTIKQLGAIGVEPPRSLLITPWSADTVPYIAKGIESANLGISAVPQGNTIRIQLPELTEERREELTKLTKSIAETSRIKMRMERDEVMKKINQEGDKDVKFKAKESLQKLVDKFNEEVDSLVESKLNEISQ